MERKELKKNVSKLCEWLGVGKKERTANQFWKLHTDLRKSRITGRSHELAKEIALHSDRLGNVLRDIRSALNSDSLPEEMTGHINSLEKRGEPLFRTYFEGADRISKEGNAVDMTDMVKIEKKFNEFSSLFNPVLSSLIRMRGRA